MGTAHPSSHWKACTGGDIHIANFFLKLFFVKPFSERKELKMDFQVLLGAVGGIRPSIPEYSPNARGVDMLASLIKVDTFILCHYFAYIFLRMAGSNFQVTVLHFLRLRSALWSANVIMQHI